MLRLACAVVLLAAMAGAAAQEKKFPARPVDMIVNFGPGGGADGLGRTVAKLVEPVLGVPVPVANVAGASGNAGLQKVLGSTPDGYTIGTMTGLTISAWLSGLGTMKVSDFAVISVSQSSPSMLFAPQGSKIQSYKQLLEMAKATPGKIRVATAGYGTLDDVAIKYLATKGVQMVNVPFAKPGERYASPLGGHSELLFEEPGDVVSFLESKQYLPLVVFGPKRHPAFPQTPASSEFGHDIDLPNWRGIVASAKVPAPIVAALDEAVRKALDTAEWKKFCAETYTCVERMDHKQSQAFVEKNFREVQAFMKQFGLAK
ncbi:MAG TPA: tripartite tricarboxylate transporter substrate binding protein [Burkholderiales bacterium]|jgi:tripartite-type tricarboxylate transporter receptor subunit TctC|nr:tripartite tricarboxylate transporter substrate binding protein [Burkholderiales bacterium]